MKKTTKLRLWKVGISICWFLLGAVIAGMIARDHYEHTIWELQIRCSRGEHGAFYPNLETKEIEFKWHKDDTK